MLGHPYRRRACVGAMAGFGAMGRALDFFSVMNRTPTSDPSNSNQFASPEHVSGGEQNQEKLLALEHVERSLDLQFGAGCGNIDEKAASPPRAIDTHDVDGLLAYEADTLCFSISPCHQDGLAAGKGGAGVNQHAVTLHTNRYREARRAAGKRSRSENRMPILCASPRQCAGNPPAMAPSISAINSANAMGVMAAPVFVPLRNCFVPTLEF